MKRPIRASLTFLDLSSDTKFGPSQSRETLPLNQHPPLPAPILERGLWTIIWSTGCISPSTKFGQI